MEQPKWNWCMLPILKLLSDGKSKNKKEINWTFFKKLWLSKWRDEI